MTRREFLVGCELCGGPISWAVHTEDGTCVFTCDMHKDYGLAGADLWRLLALHCTRA